ncbi:MAG: 1-deoxy-D-xylulose-5-phosphate reductoisomerase [Planctomycetota bacterium]
MSDRRRIAILGSTGSIGTQTLEVIAEQTQRYEVVALAANNNATLLAEQQQATGANHICLANPDATLPADRCGSWSQGPSALTDLVAASSCDLVVNAITGAAGLAANLRTAELGIDLALANKESLVMAGPLLLRAARQNGSAVLPIDSEHSAILQCLRSGERSEVRSITLTASGGPFRGRRREELESVTREQALAHPTWQMGPKISIDSATLMNKALEVIEAHVLFDLPSDAIHVVVHPQSIVHSLVEFHDGSTVAHLGPPDMRVPIQYALSHPRRWPRPDPKFSLSEIGQLTFETVDDGTFPAVRLARAVCDAGQSTPIAFNAANEVAVDLFLKQQIPFTAISDWVEKCLDQHDATPVENLDEILAIDRQTRKTLYSWI